MRPMNQRGECGLTEVVVYEGESRNSYRTTRYI